ncbi:MAG: SIS domain-containing protein [Patescibacteria group bacterium]|jgi:hypothetical protein
MKIWNQSDIYDLIKKYPQQFERGFRMAESIQLSKDKNIDQIIITAFSYNAATAEIVKNLFENDTTVPIRIHTGYGLPARITPKTLVIAISLCGKRPEVLSATKMASAAHAQVVAITTGGELEVFAREHNLPFVLIDKTISELRAPTNGKMNGGIMLAVLVQILINAGVLSSKARQNILAAVTEIENMYLPKLGHKVADLVADTHLLIYSSNTYIGLAHLFKSLLNIFATMPCFTGTIAEAMGNDVQGFPPKTSTKYFVLLFEDTTEPDFIQHSLIKLEEKIVATKLKYSTLELPGSNQLAKTLAAIMLLYWIIYGLGQESKN